MKSLNEIFMKDGFFFSEEKLIYYEQFDFDQDAGRLMYWLS